MTPDQPDRQRRRALAFNAVGPAINEAGYWLPLSARRAVADAVLDAVADELEADQRRAIRLQTLLDDTREKARRDSAASRESERQLQQQIDAQAKEIDRLRDDYRKATSALTKVMAQAAADPPLERFMGDEPSEYAQGWAAAMPRVDAALEPPKEASGV